MCEPADVKIRDHHSDLVRINELELPILPPAAGAEQSFAPDEMIDIVLCGIPKFWHKEMERQGFDRCEANKTPSDLIGFLEQIEGVEEFDSASDTVTHKKSSTSHSKKSSSYSSGKSSDDKPKCHCKKHGENYSHDIEDCKVLNGDNKKKFKSNNYKSDGNKTWKKSESEDSVTVSKKELCAMIARAVKQTAKDIFASDKKRKSSRSDPEDNLKIESDHSSVDEHSC